MGQRRHVAAGLLIGFLALPLAAAAQGADVAALIGRAQAAVKAGDHGATITALEQALDKARSDAPLTLEPFLVVSKPADYYGGYSPRGNSVFKSGEPLEFYFEPKNLVVSRAADGTYSPSFTVDLHVLTADGNVIATKEKFGTFGIASRSLIHDIFMNLTVTLTGAPAGGYQVRFVVKDANSPKTATVTQAVTVK